MAQQGAPARTQKRGDLTKRRLVEATKGLLARYDYQTITLDQIAAVGGVAKSSVLWHFGSKDGLLTEAVFELFEEVDQKINLEKSQLATLEERIDHLLAAVSNYFVANPEAKGVAITLIFNSQVPAEIHARIREQWHQHILEIRRFLSSGETEISETAAAAIMALMHGCYLQWYLLDRQADLTIQLPAAMRALYGEIERLIAADNGAQTR